MKKMLCVFTISLITAQAQADECEEIFQRIENIGHIKSYLQCVEKRIPTGVIHAWDPIIRNQDGSPTGNTRQVPEGWRVCNGTNSTPDLTGRFLYGVTSISEAGKVGGVLKIPNDGGHVHEGKTESDSAVQTHSFKCRGNCSLKTEHNHKFKTSAPNHNHGEENRPPYYSVIYICKVE